MEEFNLKILEDEYIIDLVKEFRRILRDTQDLKIATEKFIKEYGSIENNQNGALAWVALVEAQWQYGYKDDEVIKRVKKGYGYNTRPEEGLHEFEIQALKSVVEGILKKVESENPLPKSIPEPNILTPIFKKGDCLIVKHENGDYGAAIVLDAVASGVEMGQNLICSLDYLNKIEPTTEDFEERRWLFLSHHHWNDELDLGWYGPIGFENHIERIRKVGSTEITPNDPYRSLYSLGWIQLGRQILFQQQCDKEQKPKDNAGLNTKTPKSTRLLID